MQGIRPLLARSPAELVPPPPTPARGFGVRTAIAQDNLYWFGTHGVVFTSPGVVTREAAMLFDDLVATPVTALETDGSRDGRATLLHALLREKPDCSLEDVASALNVSYTRASHLFARSVGLPFRTYQHWVKCMRATQWFGGERTLAEIARVAGFADSAHLSRARQRRYGICPSYFHDRKRVRLFD
jgi:AraC-like DNA-binding protein